MVFVIKLANNFFVRNCELLSLNHSQCYHPPVATILILNWSFESAPVASDKHAMPSPNPQLLALLYQH